MQDIEQRLQSAVEYRASMNENQGGLGAMFSTIKDVPRRPDNNPEQWLRYARF